MSLVLGMVAAFAVARPCGAADSPQQRTNHDLAKDLKNPVANLTLVPLQNNIEFLDAPGDPLRYTLNIEPVIPIPLNDHWRVITRTVLPVVYQESLGLGTGDTFGLSDTELSLFLAPTEKTNGWVWGAGPVLELPTATDPLLGPQKWGAGPTAVAVKQWGGWTTGLLLNHLWSFAGAGDTDVSDTFIDLWMSYTWANGFAVNLESETHYDWEASQATVPIRAGVSQLVNFGEQPVQFNFDGLYYLEHARNAPEWGLSFTVTFVFQ